MTSNSSVESRKAGWRLKPVMTDAEVDALTHLTSEEKEKAKLTLTRGFTAGNDGWSLMGNDPELQAVVRVFEQCVISLLGGDADEGLVDYAGIPFAPMNLICWEVARFCDADWMIGLSSSLTARGMENMPNPENDAALLGVLAFPDSPLWNDEQRLVLKFVNACLANTMTDELYGEAQKTWGEKKILRMIAFIGFAQMWANLQNVVNLTWERGTSPLPAGSYPTFEKLGPNGPAYTTTKKVLDRVWDLWATL